MRSAGFRPFSSIPFLVLLSFLIGVGASAALAEEKPWTDQFLEQFEEIKTRISKIEQAQKDTLAEKDKILAEVDRTRVWARHSGNRGGAHA